MCLGIPGKVTKINEQRMAEIDIGGISREASLHLLPQVKVGDYVIVHAGFAIQEIDEKEAQETLKIFKELSEIPE